MKSFIHELGVIDKNNIVHPVSLQEGLNIITGKSSTGKSAIIEIFDYCFGSSEYTIPAGIITDNAQVYYVILQVQELLYLLAREPKKKRNDKIYLRNITNGDDHDLVSLLENKAYWLPSADFRKSLNAIYELDYSNVDLTHYENKISYGRKKNKKSPTPSIRSFVSFMLQHQNLIANKHALFYRFDEKEKKDQVIDHTKNFLNLVDQQYYLFSQEKEELEVERKRLERIIEFNNRSREKNKKEIQDIIDEIYGYLSFTSLQYPKVSAISFLNDPLETKDKFNKLITFENLTIDTTDEFYLSLERNFRENNNKISKLKMQRRALKNAIDEKTELLNNISEVEFSESILIPNTVVCPFCKSNNHELESDALKLHSAILSLSQNFLSLKPSTSQYEVKIVEIDKDLSRLKIDTLNLKDRLLEIEAANKSFQENRGLYELALTQKGKLFGIVDNLTIIENSYEAELEQLVISLSHLNKMLKEYDFSDKLDLASKKVNAYMKEIGAYFDIEESYKEGVLKFDFKTFELYFLSTSNEKIYLRSMGSGANWLYCHVTLFLALHKYFVELGDKCNIPSILFLDQPTQVYFPNFSRDNNSSFEDMKNLEKKFRNEVKDQGINIRGIDDDMMAVTKLFSKLALYCENLKEEYGYSPQIIVTDHADNLMLTGFNFEDFVNGNRWRDRGLINPVPQGKM